jgi:Tol biopolymer transport system component
MRDAKSDHLSLLSNSAWWRRQAWHSTAISTQFQVIGGIAANENGKELLLLTAMHPQAELVRYSPSIRSYTALLPGQSATYVDISRDMSSATYVDSQSFSLWVSRTDGSDRRQLSPPGMSVELPRWSPDGKLIAFMANTSHRTYRVFIVPASGREIKEASEGDDSQGAPTWSPDGRYLVYGGVLCQESHSCAIHRIDLQTGHVTTIPGSTGLQTARWSPDGRHIAALDGVQKQLRVFDFGREEWRTLAEGIDGNDVSWSSDSRFVYTKRSSSGKTEIVRVAIDGGSLQTALNLDSFGKSMGDPGIWFSVAPDNSVLISRWVNGAEIYSLSYEMR